MSVIRKLSLIFAFLVLASLPNAVFSQDNVGETTHVVQPGENLFRIALNYGLTTEELAAANGITDPTRILVGQTLIIPGSDDSTPEEAPETTVVEAAPETTNQAASPDTATDDPLVIEAPTDPNIDPMAPVNVEELEQQSQPIYHTVLAGDTLRSIAIAYGTTEESLIADNNIANPNRIIVGQQLIVGTETAASAAPTTEVEAPAAEASEGETVIHTVQRGEYLSSIARRYGISNDMIIAANNIGDPNQLYAGQQLVIPVGVTAEEAAAVLYPTPNAVHGTGRELVVDLSNSRVYAFENGMLMYEAVSSNGLPVTPTVRGEFTVQSKVRSQTMSGPGYWLPNVEWVMYFYQNYALHGAYWHDNWGQPMSHGCVNLKNQDAKWFFEFAEIGTPVTVQF